MLSLHSMKSVLATITLCSFIAIAVFGFMAMMHGNAMGHDGCIAATAEAATCPIKISPWELIPFHIDIYKNFSTATLLNTILSTLTALFALALLIAIKVFYHFLLSQTKSSLLLTPITISSSEEKINTWLSRHENSPSNQ